MSNSVLQSRTIGLSGWPVVMYCVCQYSGSGLNSIRAPGLISWSCQSAGSGGHIYSKLSCSCQLFVLLYPSAVRDTRIFNKFLNKVRNRIFESFIPLQSIYFATPKIAIFSGLSIIIWPCAVYIISSKPLRGQNQSDER